MKLDTLDHPKTYSLTGKLGCELPTTVGYLQFLWKFVGQHAAQGNIGKWDDDAIARACLWRGEPETFISSLVAAGFLDRNDLHRLMVHDWQDHAPSWVRAKLKKLGLEFVLVNVQESLLLDDTDDQSIEHTSEATVEHSYRGEERSGKEKRGVEKKKFFPPTEQDVIKYFTENGYPSSLATRAYKGYAEASWHDSHGNKIKNWKQKMQHVWFKLENKTNGIKPSKLQRTIAALS